MSIRRLLIWSLVAINLLTMLGLLVYLSREESIARQVFRERRRLMEATRERLLSGFVDEEALAILDEFEAQVGESIAHTLAAHRGLDLSERAVNLRLLLAVREIPILESSRFTALVESAVLVRLPEEGLAPASAGAESFPTFFNLSRELIFPEPISEQSEPRNFVRNAVYSEERYGQGRRLAGPLRVRGRSWGGYYLRLTAPSAQRLERADPGVSVFAVLVLAAPGLLLGPILLWRVLSRRVIGPLEQIGAVAETVAEGDYRPRLDAGGRDDEVARTMRVLNTMLDLVQGYRDTLEDRVQQKSHELQARHEELRRAQRLAATGTLAAGIAHEINNPLGGMLNAARRLQREDLPPPRRERYLAILEEGIERIGAIVRRVLEVAPRQMTPTEVDVSEVLARAVELLGHRARAKKVRIETHVGPNLPRVWGESNELGQVALNLLINAVDASPEGGTVRVEALERETGHVELSFRDEGPGMDPATREQAFDLFFTTKGSGGTGLGLALVHGIVDGHGGTIEVRSSPGAGTTVLVLLPARGSEP